MNIRRNDTPQPFKLEDTKSPKSKTNDSFLKLSQKQDDFKPMVYTVKSDTNPNQEYTITNYRLNFWRCSCRDFVFRGVDSKGHAKIPPYRCKHLRKLLKELEGET